MTVTIDEFWLTFLASVGLPIVTALIKRRYSQSWVGAVVLLVLSVLSGWLTSLYATGGVFEVRAAVVAVVLSFVTAASVHYGLLKPVGLTGNQGVILRAAPGGLGPVDREVAAFLADAERGRATLMGAPFTVTESSPRAAESPGVPPGTAGGAPPGFWVP